MPVNFHGFEIQEYMYEQQDAEKEKKTCHDPEDAHEHIHVNTSARTRLCLDQLHKCGT